MEKSVIIVGGGIAGLTAGCYAAMNGYRTSLFEMHSLPGGLCTAWHKKGYTFDISMHMLTGSLSGPFHRMWEELGVTREFKFHYHDHISVIEGMGKKLLMSAGRKEFEEQMIAISPEDTKRIKEFAGIVFGHGFMEAASLNPSELSNAIDKMKTWPVILPLMPFFIKYGKTTIQQFAEKFKDPFLKQAVKFFVDSPGWPMPDFPMIALAGFMRNAVTEAGVPLGGSQKVAYHIARLFKQNGGTIHYNSRVRSLIIENNRVEGIELDDGSERPADYVIWAADGHTLHYEVLEGKYLDDTIRNMYENWMPVKSIVHVMIGVNRNLSGESHRLVIEMDEPVVIGEHTHRWMAVKNHSFDKSMAPAGKSEIEVWFDTEYEYWEQLASNREEYIAEKKRISDHVLRQLEKKWPGFTSQVEVIDVPTPVTYKRYTGNWKGSPDGWYLTPENINSMEPVTTLPRLDRLYMAGQWTAPFTGTVIAALSGRQAVQLMCRKDNIKFNTVSAVKKTEPAEI